MEVNMDEQKFETFFSKLFSNIILKNKIVSSVLYIVMQQVKAFNKKLNIVINEDI